MSKKTTLSSILVFFECLYVVVALLPAKVQLSAMKPTS